MMLLSFSSSCNGVSVVLWVCRKSIGPVVTTASSSNQLGEAVGLMLLLVERYLVTDPIIPSLSLYLYLITYISVLLFL